MNVFVAYERRCAFKSAVKDKGQLMLCYRHGEDVARI